MNDEPFTKADIITLQDPLNIEQRDLSQFDYVKRELKTSDCTSFVLASVRQIEEREYRLTISASE